MKHGRQLRCDGCGAAIPPGDPLGIHRYCANERKVPFGRYRSWKIQTLCSDCLYAQATRPFLPRSFDGGQNCRHCDRPVYHARAMKKKTPYCDARCRFAFSLWGWSVAWLRRSRQPVPSTNALRMQALFMEPRTDESSI